VIRRATHADLGTIVRLGIAALEHNALENMLISAEKVRCMAIETVSAAKHFAWVAEIDGEVRGAVIAVSHECMFYERQQATVVMFWCPGYPGHWLSLLRAFIRWADARPIIKMKAFALEHDADPRIQKVLSRLGFDKALPSFIQTR